MNKKRVIVIALSKTSVRWLIEKLSAVFQKKKIKYEVVFYGTKNRSVNDLARFFAEQLELAGGHENIFCVCERLLQTYPHASPGGVSNNILIDHTKVLLGEHADGFIDFFKYKEERTSIWFKVLSTLAKTPEQIVISGTSVSGKGTLAGDIQRVLGYKHYSAGTEVAREFAKKHSMLLDEFVQYIEKDPILRKEYDTAIDDWNKKILKEKKRICLECRLGGLWASNKAFKVFITTSNKLAGERLYKQTQEAPSERKAQVAYASPAAAAIGIKARNSSDKDRYIEDYDFDFTDRRHYTYVINNNASTKSEDLVVRCLGAYENFLIREIKKQW